MRSHQQIDQRSLALAKAIVKKIESDSELKGLETARGVCDRWLERNQNQAIQEWSEILKRPWNEIRPILLSESENSQRLRQSSPFCGILTSGERKNIYHQYSDY